MAGWQRVADRGAASRLIDQVTVQATVRRALDWVDAHPEFCPAQAAAFATTPAPTFAEGQRADQFEQSLRRIGLAEIERFEHHNVLCRFGPATGSGVAFLAHLDTVFAASIDHRVRSENGRLKGPGVGDNASGLAGILTAAAALHAAGYRPGRPIWFVADSAEEGLGDLRGARETLQYFEGRLEAVVAVEGTMLGRLGHIAVGSRRLQARFTAPGGHSWHDYGRASAVHTAVLAAARIASLELPSDPRTTLNIGQISGGEGVNVLASQAEFLLDLRSLSATVLDQQYRRIREIVRGQAEVAGVKVELVDVGNRPAGALERSHPLAEICAAAIARTGLRAESSAGSTDANIALGQGLPAIALGITRGAGTHSVAEWVETAPMTAGVKQLILVAAALSEAR